MHGVFPSRPGALAPIFVEIGFRAFRQVAFPSDLEAGPRFVEARRVTAAGETAT